MSALAINGGKAVRQKPFPRWPVFDDTDRRAIEAAFDEGMWAYDVSGNALGPRAVEFARRFAARQGARYGFSVTNGSAALETALLAADVGLGDEVIVPPLTFAATAVAVMKVNAVPVFADVEESTYCLAPRRVEEAITPKTKAIIPVHLGACLADMDGIMEVANRHGLIVIEDCAHVPGARWQDRGAGAIGHLGCFSFQLTKPLTCGEGGLIITSDQELAERCHSAINCSRNQHNDKYRPKLMGWNYRMGEFQAALLLTQLERLDEQIAHRTTNLHYLVRQIADLPGITTVFLDQRVTARQIYYFTLKCDARAFGTTREHLGEALAAEGIPVGWSYTPLYRNPLFTDGATGDPLPNPYHAARVHFGDVRCPIAEDAASRRAINLSHPLFLGGSEDMDDVATALWKLHKHRDELRQ